MRIKIGDIVEIPLSQGRKAFAQYVYWDEKNGPLIQVFDLIIDYDEKIDLREIEKAKSLFPPVITGLFAVIRRGLWKIVGNLPVKEFNYPGFISTFYDEKTGEAKVWFLWNGSEAIRLGKHLPEKYKRFEYLAVWSPIDIADRIETGEYPFPYRDLIHHNRFTPKR